MGFAYAAWVLGPPLALAERPAPQRLVVAVPAGRGARRHRDARRLHATLGDPAQFWSPVVRQLAEEMQRRGLSLGLEDAQLVEALARSLWGWITVLTLLLGMCAVFLARWWQGLESQPGGLSARSSARCGWGACSASWPCWSWRRRSCPTGRWSTISPGSWSQPWCWSGWAVPTGFASNAVQVPRGSGRCMCYLYSCRPSRSPAIAGVGFVDNWLRSRRGRAPGVNGRV